MLAALDVGSPHLPEPPESAGGSETDLGFAGFSSPVQRSTEIVPLAVELPRCTHLLGAEQRRLRILGKPEIEVGVAAARRLAVPALGEALERVFPHRFQHSEARLALGHALGTKQAVVEERL